ncbi:MAG TPA: ABC transporter ATP-binding protein [Streptosporangiaceae bacterium]
MNQAQAIVADRLTRDYPSRDGARRALDEVSFTVPYGHVVGVLGPNGAGKTTCVRILTTLLLPTSGMASVAGIDVVAKPQQARRVVGVSFGGETGLYPRLTGRDNLRYFSTMYGLSGRRLESRVTELLERVGLADRARDRVDTYSRGMWQRLHIARALLHDPRVLLLDEPSSGLDPGHARQLRALVGELRDEGRAILLTTHDLVEAEEVCQSVIILDHGRTLRDTTVRELRTEAARSVGHRIELEPRRAVPVEVLEAVPGLVRFDHSDPQILHVYTTDAAAAASFLMGKLADDVVSLHINTPSLAEAYLATVGSS